MAINLIKGSDDVETLEGVDRHYYANQVGPSSPFDTTWAFRMAAARAKDRARHHLIKAIRIEERRIRSERNRFTELIDRVSNAGTGDADYSAEARRNVLANRTVDGVKGAGDNAIKL